MNSKHMYLLVQRAKVLHEVVMLSLQRAHADGVAPEFVANTTRLLVDALERVLAVVEVFMQLAGCC